MLYLSRETVPKELPEGGFTGMPYASFATLYL